MRCVYLGDIGILCFWGGCFGVWFLEGGGGGGAGCGCSDVMDLVWTVSLVTREPPPRAMTITSHPSTLVFLPSHTPTDSHKHAHTHSHKHAHTHSHKHAHTNTDTHTHAHTPTTHQHTHSLLQEAVDWWECGVGKGVRDRKSTRLNSSHL